MNMNGSFELPPFCAPKATSKDSQSNEEDAKGPSLASEVAAMSTAVDAGDSLVLPLILVCALAPPLALTFVVLRLYTAWKVLGKFHHDDCELVSLLC